MTTVVHEVGACDETEGLLDAVVILLPVHVDLGMPVEAERRVVGVLVVVEGAKISAGRIGSVDRVVRQNVITPEMSGVRLAVNRTTIEQFADTQCLVSLPQVVGCGAGALFAGPPRVPRARVENRSRPCVTCLASIPKEPVFGFGWLHRVFGGAARVVHHPRPKPLLCPMTTKLQAVVR